MPLIRRLNSDERGATLAYVAISLPVILGFAGIGVDIAVWNLDKRESQTMADAAAMEAGVSVLRSGDFALINQWGLDGAERNGFDAANGDTITINNPPSVGDLSAAIFGDPDGDGVFGDTDAIEVFIRRPAVPLLSSLVLNNTNNQFVQSRAVVRAINDPGKNCMISLEPSPSGIKLSGGATVNLDCGALSNGDLTLAGAGACLNATQVLVVDPNPDANCVPAVPTVTRPDPLRFLPEIERRSCDVNGNPPINLGKTKDMYPKLDGILVICGDIVVNAGGTLNLHPGVYVLHNANLSVGGTLNTVGGAMIYFSEAATSSNSISIAGGATVNFDPLTSGMIDTFDAACATSGNFFSTPPGAPTLLPCSTAAVLSDGSNPDGHGLDEVYEGIAFFADRDAVDGVSYNFSGGATMSINGVIYLPGGDVVFSGGVAGDVKAILADNVTVSGNSDFGTIDGTILSSLLAFVFIKLVE